MANIKFSQFTSQVPSSNTQIVGYNSATSTNTRCTIAELSSALGLTNYVTLSTTQTIAGQKQFSTFPILSSIAYTASYGNEVKLYSSHDSASRWIFNSDGVHNKIFSFRVNDLQRWAFRVNQDAESGSNAGTNFELRRYNDAGTFIDSPISVSRQTGQVDFGGNIQLLSSMLLGDGVTLSNSELQALEGIGTTITIQQQLDTRPTVIAKMSISPASVGAVTTEANLDSYEIPAGTFAVGDSFEIHMNCYFAGTAGTRSPKVRLNNSTSGSVLISPNALASSVLGYSTVSFCRVIDSSNIAVAVNSIGGGAGGTGSGLVSFTAANANTIYFNGQKANSADTFVLYDWKIVKINA